MESDSENIERKLEEFLQKVEDKDKKLSDRFTIVDNEVEKKLQDLNAEELMQRWKLAKKHLLFRYISPRLTRIDIIFIRLIYLLIGSEVNSFFTENEIPV